jgi:hypothetical protein
MDDSLIILPPFQNTKKHVWIEGVLLNYRSYWLKNILKGVNIYTKKHLDICVTMMG